MSKSPSTPSSPAAGAPPSLGRVMQILLGVAGLALVVGGAIIALMNAQISDFRKTAADKEAKVGSNQLIAQRYQATLTTYNAISSRAQYLETSVSAKSYVPTLLQQLQGLAQQTHLTVNAVRPGPITVPAPPAKPASTGDTAAGAATPAPEKKAPPPPYDTLGIDVDVTGSYANTVAFLYGLTRFPKIISVASAQLKPGTTATAAPPPGTAPAAPLVSTSLHLTAFVFHDDAAAPAGSAPSKTPGAPAAPVPAQPAPSTHAAPGSSVVSDAAQHAAVRATGASKAIQARSEVGLTTM